MALSFREQRIRIDPAAVEIPRGDLVPRSNIDKPLYPFSKGELLVQAELRIIDDQRIGPGTLLKGSRISKECPSPFRREVEGFRYGEWFQFMARFQKFQLRGFDRRYHDMPDAEALTTSDVRPKAHRNLLVQEQPDRHDAAAQVCIGIRTVGCEHPLSLQDCDLFLGTMDAVGHDCPGLPEQAAAHIDGSVVQTIRIQLPYPVHLSQGLIQVGLYRNAVLPRKVSQSFQQCWGTCWDEPGRDDGPDKVRFLEFTDEFLGLHDGDFSLLDHGGDGVPVHVDLPHIRPYPRFLEQSDEKPGAFLEHTAIDHDIQRPLTDELRDEPLVDAFRIRKVTELLLFRERVGVQPSQKLLVISQPFVGILRGMGMEVREGRNDELPGMVDDFESLVLRRNLIEYSKDPPFIRNQESILVKLKPVFLQRVHNVAFQYGSLHLHHPSCLYSFLFHHRLNGGTQTRKGCSPSSIDPCIYLIGINETSPIQLASYIVLRQFVTRETKTRVLGGLI